MAEAQQEPDPETVRRFRGLLEDTLNRHLSHADALDAKAWQALGVGSIVLGLGVAGDLRGWWLVAPLVPYLALVGAVSVSVHVRRWKTTPEGDRFWSEGWFRGPASFDRTVVNALVKAEPHNRKHLKWKGWAVRIAVGCLVAEIVALAAAAGFA